MTFASFSSLSISFPSTSTAFCFSRRNRIRSGSRHHETLYFRKYQMLLTNSLLRFTWSFAFNVCYYLYFHQLPSIIVIFLRCTQAIDNMELSLAHHINITKDYSDNFLLNSLQAHYMHISDAPLNFITTWKNLFCSIAIFSPIYDCYWVGLFEMLFSAGKRIGSSKVSFV